METYRPIILLDRDGVLNRIVIDPEHGTIDSPLHPSQVEIFPWVPQALLTLNQLGYDLAIVTNQPSAAKRKTSLKNLQKTHDHVLELSQAAGATILSSHICFHKKEDACTCRKPKTGLLEEALLKNKKTAEKAWMVGDGVTDIEAGKRLNIQTAFLGPKKCDACKIFSDSRISPNFWGENLKSFVDSLLDQK